MLVHIREVSYDDLPAIVEIYNDEILHRTATFDTWPTTVGERGKWLVLLRAESYPCFVAEVADEATGNPRTIGWCNLGRYNATTRPAYKMTAEVSLYVHKDFQGKGIGSKLFRHLVEHLEPGRFHTIIAAVTTDDPRRMEFWKRQSFMVSGTLREVSFKFGKFLDVAYMQFFCVNGKGQ
ncbi:GCN5-related N-acetyltransferase [Trametes maxima]|nr:GCN5-related N-acetyltransferase [Trametes maxima]